MNRLSARERRLVALGLLVALLSLLWLAVIGPLLAGFEARRLERETLAARFAGGERIIATMRVSRAQARAQRRTQAIYAIEAATPALAAEALRERVVGAVRAAGGVVGVAQETQAAPGWVRVRADLQLGIDELDRALRSIEGRPPYVVVEALSVVSDRALISARADTLDVRLEVAARHAPSPPGAGLASAAADAARR